jgi:hypothetical protein
MFVLSGCLIVFGLSDSASGQKAVDRSLAASFGGSNLHILDELASPLIFSNTGIAPSIQYYAMRKKSLQYAEGSFYYDHLKTTQNNFSIRNYSGRFRYSYLYIPFHLKLAEHNINISFGGSFTSFFNGSDYDYENYYYSTENRAIVTWYWSHSLDIGFHADYFLNKGAFFSLQWYIPVVSNVSRPTYSSSGDYNYTSNTRDISACGETMFFPENISFNSLITFQKPLKEKLSLQLTYEFFLTQYGEPEEITMYMNNFRIGLSYYFRKSLL